MVPTRAFSCRVKVRFDVPERHSPSEGHKTRGTRKECHVGAVAFSRTGDPATADFSDAKVIRKWMPPALTAFARAIAVWRK
jgi:hypothetical protein